MKNTSSRIRDFKIGCFHGKLVPEDRSIEATLRNELFLIGSLKIEITKAQSKDIRLVAYELPLQIGQSRGQCIDLLGYDQDKTPWIIELKKSNSKEKLDQVVNQIHRYENCFQILRKNIEREIQAKYHWKEFKFSESINKMILAHREYYQNVSPENYKSIGIYCCSFCGIRSNREKEISLLKKFGSKGFVRLKIENK